jgi:hypothetical protein
MQRTNYRRTGDYAVAQRATLVGALIFYSREVVAQVEDGQFDNASGTADGDRSSFPRRNAFRSRYARPVAFRSHAKVFSKG